MFEKIKNILKTDLIRTSFFTSIATAVKILTAFILNKIVAIYIGPIGIAIIGQFQNFFGIAGTIGSGGISTGVIKYIAENKKDENENKKIISTSFIFILICSVITGLILFIFSGYFSFLVFKTTDDRFIIRIISFSLIFASLNSLLMSILNGLKEIKKYTLANILTNLTVLVLSVLLVMKYKITGVLIAIIIGQSFIFFITLFFVVKSKWFKISWFIGNFNNNILKKLSNYSIMTLVSSTMGPASLLIIRNYIGNHLSWKDAGYWQGIWTISEVYLTFITSSLAVYYLPRLSEIKQEKDFKKEIFHTSKIILPIVFCLALIIFLIKYFVISILFTSEFLPMIPLFKYQLAGDVIKIACWLLAYNMLAKAMTKTFIISEIIFNLTFIGLMMVCVSYFGLIGTTIAFCINYIIYFVFLIFVFRKVLLSNDK